MRSGGIRGMYKLYSSGMIPEEVGRIYGVSGCTVHRRLRAAGYHVRNKSEARIGELNKSWKGGRIITKGGYVRVWMSGGKYVLEHRLMMERAIGRPLASEEVVHHVNGNVSDNRIENLRLLASNSEHMKQDHLRGSWSRNYDACIRCGTTSRKHAGKGYCINCHMYLRAVKRRGGECQYDASGKRIFTDEHRRRLSAAAFRHYGRRRRKSGGKARAERAL